MPQTIEVEMGVLSTTMKLLQIVQSQLMLTLEGGLELQTTTSTTAGIAELPGRQI